MLRCCPVGEAFQLVRRTVERAVNTGLLRGPSTNAQHWPAQSEFLHPATQSTGIHRQLSSSSLGAIDTPVCSFKHTQDVAALHVAEIGGLVVRGQPRT